MIFECVLNISEGRDKELINKITEQFKPKLVDVHSDFDHNRSVFTFATRDLEQLDLEIKRFTSEVVSKFGFKGHKGVHPKVGLIDVAPFVSYDNESRFPSPSTIATATEFGDWISAAHGIDVYFYEAASRDKRSLPQVRKMVKQNLLADIVSSEPIKLHGATCVGARQPLVAINVNLDTMNTIFVDEIVKSIRESSGGIKNVRALSFELKSQNKSQVSMNIIDALETNAGSIALKIRDAAHQFGIKSEVELVGLVPDFQFRQWNEEFLTWSKLDYQATIESKLDSR